MEVHWNIARLLWLFAVLALVLWLPAAFAPRRKPSLHDVLEGFVGTTLATVIAVSVLSPLRLLNPVSLALALAAWPMLAWTMRHRHGVRAAAEVRGRQLVMQSAIWFETGGQLGAARERLRRMVHAVSIVWRGEETRLNTILVVVGAVGLLLAPRLVTALVDTRLANAEAYTELVATQRLLAGDLDSLRPRLFASLMAALSLASSIAAIHVVRLIMPIVGLAVVLSLMVVVRRATGNLGPALIAAIGSSTLAMFYPRVPGHELADVFVFLSLYFWQSAWSGSRASTAAALVSTMLVGLAAPPLLLVVCFSAAALMLKPWLMLPTAGTLWLALPLLVQTDAVWNQPAAIGLLAAAAFHACSAGLRCESAARSVACSVAVTTGVVMAVTPRVSAAHYVEYDAAARKTLDITAKFPRYRFLIAAPIEQWALSYGRGWHINLHDFVDAVRARADDSGFRMPFAVDDVFVFVETRPFATFSTEPRQIPFSLLTDPVFRHYRSLAGRSSLQFAALEVCERLRRRMAARIYYEDDQLRIYHFTLR